MTTLIAIGFLGGLITGISPCILPVLPVIFFSGTPAGTTAAAGSGAVATAPALSSRLRPYLVIAGLRLIFPQCEVLPEQPFARLPQKQSGSGSSGFGLGLTLGVRYVPCAGPVRA